MGDLEAMNRIDSIALLETCALAVVFLWGWLLLRRRAHRKADMEAVERIIAGWQPKPRYNYRRRGRFAKRYGSFPAPRDLYDGN